MSYQPFFQLSIEYGYHEMSENIFWGSIGMFEGYLSLGVHERLVACW